MLIPGTLRWHLRRCAAFVPGMRSQLACLDAIMWSFITARGGAWCSEWPSVSGRVGVEAADRGSILWKSIWGGSRAEDGRSADGRTFGPGFLMSNALTSLRRDTAAQPVSRSAYSRTFGRKGMGNARE